MAPVTAGPAEPGGAGHPWLSPGGDEVACVVGAAEPPSACVAGCRALSPRRRPSLCHRGRHLSGGLPEPKRRRADPGARTCHSLGVRASAHELRWKELQLFWGAGPSPGCGAAADPSAGDAVSILSMFLHVTEGCVLKLPWPAR